MRKLFLPLLLSIPFLGGCSLEASILSTGSSITGSGSKTLEVVSFSQQKVHSLSGKTVSASSGTPYSQLVGTSAQGKYKVYSTVQGHFISDEKAIK